MTNKKLELAKKKEAAMKHLIKEALTRYDADQLLEFLYEVSELTDREYLEQKMLDMTVERGFVYLKCDNILQAQAVEDFGKQLFPFYNSQQTNIFA